MAERLLTDDEFFAAGPGGSDGALLTDDEFFGAAPSGAGLLSEADFFGDTPQANFESTPPPAEIPGRIPSALDGQADSLRRGYAEAYGVEPQPAAEGGGSQADDSGRTLAGNVGELGRGVVRGTVDVAGGGAQGLATSLAAGDVSLRDNIQAEIQRGTNPVRPGDPTAAARNLRNIASQLEGEQRARILDIAGRLERGEDIDELSDSAARTMGPVTPPSERGLYQTGEAISEFGRSLAPIKPGYEGSLWGEFGSAMGSLFGFGLLSAAGGPLASFSAAGVLGVQEQFERAKATGMSERQALDYAMQGAAPGAVQAVSVELVLRRLPPNIRAPLLQRMRTVAEAFGSEFAVENLGQVWQNIVEQQYNPERDPFEGTPYAGILSGSAAAALTAIVQAALPGKRIGGGLHGPSTGQQAESPVTPPEGFEPLMEGDQQVGWINRETGVGLPLGEGAPTAPKRMAPVTPEDEASPIPTEIISRGKAVLEDAAAGRPLDLDTGPADAPETPSQTVQQQREQPAPTDAPAAGSAVTVTYPDGDTVTGTVRGTVDMGDGMAFDILGQDGTPYLVYPNEARIEARAEPQGSAVEPVGSQMPPAEATQAVEAPAPAPEAPQGDGSREAPVTVTQEGDLDAVAPRVEAEPTEAQKEAGNYRKAHARIAGLDVTIENPRGSVRRGTSPDGTAWEVTMPAAYGYVKRTTGADGDQVDVYVGPNPAAQRVYVVDQIDAGTRRFDEHKAMLGFDSMDEALAAYDAGFSDGRGPARRGEVVEMSVEQFKAMLRDGDMTKPLFYGEGPEVAQPPAPAAKPARKRPSRPGKPMDILTFLASRGGIRDDEGHGLREARNLQRFVPRQGPLIRPKGMSIDEAGEALWEAGYFGEGRERPTVAETLDLLDNMGRAGRLYRPADQAEVDAAAADTEAAEQETRTRDDILAFGREIGEIFTRRDMDAIRSYMDEYGADPETAVEAYVERRAIQDASAYVEESGNDRYDPQAAYEPVPGFEPDGETADRSATEPAGLGEGEGEPARRSGRSEDQRRDEGQRPEDAPDAREAGVVSGPEGSRERVASPATEQTDQGEQTVIPGAERASQRQQAERGRAERLRPDQPQQGVDGLGLFDPQSADVAQEGLFDRPAATEAQSLADFISVRREASADNARRKSGAPLTKAEREAYLAGFDQRLAEIEGTPEPAYDVRNDAAIRRRAYERGQRAVDFLARQHEADGGPEALEMSRTNPTEDFDRDLDDAKARFLERALAVVQREAEAFIRARLGDRAEVRARQTIGEGSLGRFSAKVRDQQVRALIEVALDGWDTAGNRTTTLRDMPSLTGTMRHEIVHALRHLGVIDRPRWDVMARRGRALREKHRIDQAYADYYRAAIEDGSEGVAAYYADLYGHDPADPDFVGKVVDEMLTEEAVAEEYRTWAETERTSEPLLKRAFEIIRDFIERIDNALRGNGFLTTADVFGQIEDGTFAGEPASQPAGVAGIAMEQRPTKDTEAEAAAALKAEAGMGHNGGPPLGTLRAKVRGEDSAFIKDMGLFGKYAVYPRTLAAISRTFAPVYRAATEQFHRRDVMIANLSDEAQPYFALPNASKEKVNAALERGRLYGEIYGRGKAEVVAADPDGLAQIRKGETIRLTEAEKSGYWAVRRTMDMALDRYKEQILREFGIDPAEVAGTDDIQQMIDRAEGAEARSLQVAARLLREIEQAKRTGYVPFARFGDIVVVARKKVDQNEIDPLTGNPMEYETVWSTTIESGTLTGLAAKLFLGGKLGKIPAVRKAMDDAKARYGSDPDVEITVFQSGKKGLLDGNGMSLHDIDALSEVAKFDQNQYERLVEAFKTVQQQRSFRRHFFGARNVPGYSTDFERSIADYVTGIGAYLARREMNEPWERALAGIPDQKPREREYALKYRDYINNPTEEFSTLRQAGFVYYIAGNVSTAALNLTQVPLFTMPYLTMFSNPARISAEFGRAYKDSGMMIGRRAGLDIFDPDKAPADVREALKQAWAEGRFVPLVTFEMMGTAHNRTPALRGLAKGTRTAIDALALTYSFAERMNRVATFVAAYRIAKADPKGVQEKLKAAMKKNELAQLEVVRDFSPEKFAQWVVDETHFALGKVNRPTIMRGMGAAILQFKSFMMNALELQYRMAVKYGRPGKVAFGLNIAALFLTAGVWGIPFADDLAELIDMIYGWWTDLDYDVRTEVRKIVAEVTGSPKIAEMFSRGTLRASGVDMSGRIGMGRIVPRDFSEAAGVPASITLGKALAMADYLKRDQALLAAGEILPNALKNPVHAMSWAQDGVRSTATGRKVAEVTTGEAAMKALGFTPARISNLREADWAKTRADRAVDKLRALYYTRLAREIADSLRAQDEGKMEAAAEHGRKVNEIFSEIDRYNAGAEPHRMVIMSSTTLKRRVQEEFMGTALRDEKGRRSTRAYRQDLDEVFGVER